MLSHCPLFGTGRPNAPSKLLIELADIGAVGEALFDVGKHGVAVGFRDGAFDGDQQPCCSSVKA
jgi:hypothetical protein